jgi:cyclophilin family peptidyl-prolyl cis-trans isomerase
MKLFGLIAAVGVFMSMSEVSNAANPVVTIETSLGTLKVELFEDKAPISVKNFLSYVDDKHYDGCIFHRVISNFMVQGGGFDGDYKEKKTKDSIKNESTNGLKNDRGTLAMARTNVPDSATSQFFINVVDNDFLNRARAQDGVGYAVFGRVIEGMDVVDKLKNVEKQNRGGAFTDSPKEKLEIKSIKRNKGE